MKLVTEEVRKPLPAIGASGENPVAPVKFFQPWGPWTWYVFEYDGAEEFFGYVVGLEPELGYFFLSELEGERREGADYAGTLRRWCVVTFAEKPSRAVLDALKAAGFHWSAPSWRGDTDNLPACVAAMEAS